MLQSRREVVGRAAAERCADARHRRPDAAAVELLGGIGDPLPKGLDAREIAVFAAEYGIFRDFHLIIIMILLLLSVNP